MIFIDSKPTDPYFNMAMEEYLFTQREDDVCVLWQNSPAIIVGKHQNTMAEIDYEYTLREKIPVVRRMSGGGCVFHDLGNLNFTYIVNKGEFGDYAGFTRSLRNYMHTLGLKAELSGRNDLLIDGRKFSGNAQHYHKGRLLHHGTILLGADMKHLTLALKPDEEKIKSKGIKSVKSRVANINEFSDISVEEFRRGFGQAIIKETGAEVYEYTAHDMEEIQKLAKEKYSTFEWNFGFSPKYSFRKKKRFSGGGIEVLMNIEEGIIREVTLYGDFFSERGTEELTLALTGCKHDADAISDVLSGLDTGKYLGAITAEEFLSCVI